MFTCPLNGYITYTVGRFERSSGPEQGWIQDFGKRGEDFQFHRAERGEKISGPFWG